MTDLLSELGLEIPAGVHPPGPSSLELAERIPDCTGKIVLDLGCGTGLFALVAAKRGASEAWATDIDPVAVECARKNAARHGVKIHTAVGNWFEPVKGRRFDWIITNPPQTPAPEDAVGPKFGGPDGLRYFERILREAPDFLAPGGRILTLLISLADTERFTALASARFYVTLLGDSRRDFTRDEYEGYRPGLFEFLLQHRARFETDGTGGHFRVRYFEARLR